MGAHPAKGPQRDHAGGAVLEAERGEWRLGNGGQRTAMEQPSQRQAAMRSGWKRRRREAKAKEGKGVTRAERRRGVVEPRRGPLHPCRCPHHVRVPRASRRCTHKSSASLLASACALRHGSPRGARPRFCRRKSRFSHDSMGAGNFAKRCLNKPDITAPCTTKPKTALGIHVAGSTPERICIPSLPSYRQNKNNPISNALAKSYCLFGLSSVSMLSLLRLPRPLLTGWRTSSGSPGRPPCAVQTHPRQCRERCQQSCLHGQTCRRG